MQFKFVVTVTITESGMSAAEKLGVKDIQSEILDSLKKELEPQSDEQATLTVENFA